MAGLWGLVLSQYALLFGLAVLVLAAALAAAIIFRKRGLTPSRSNHTDHYITYSDFDRMLEVLRREFGHSFDSAQTAARNAAAIGEKVIAAVRPIESALRDLNNRLVNLEKHAKKLSSQDNGPAADNLHLEGLEQQLIEVTDRIPSLMKMIDEVRERESGKSALIEALDGNLTNVQSKIDSFNLRLDSGENRQATCPI